MVKNLDFIESSVHICVVANQVVPNLAPILDRNLKAKRVVLVHTADFLQKAKDLASTYSNYQVKTEFFKIQSAFDIVSLRKDMQRLFNFYAEQKPLINITGGTKIISLAMFEKAKEYELPVYYVNTDDSLSWLVPDVESVYHLEDRVKIKPFLTANGFEVVVNELPSSNKLLRQVLDDLIANIDGYKEAISQLNYYAYTASSSLKSVSLSENVEGLRKLVGLFAETGLMKIENNKLIFKDEDARFFANGGWLEEYLFHQIKQLGSKIPKIQDNLCAVEVCKKTNSVKNEIDNMLLCNNNLYLIECKTKRFSKDQSPEGGVSSAIYKLDTLMRELGGTFARGMIVSIFELSKADYARAKQYNIKIVSLSELKDIKRHLTNWLS